MAVPLTVQPEAQAEIEAIRDVLETERAGLGDRFVDALAETFGYIRQFPAGFQLRRGRYRHAPLSGFDIRVVYMLDEGHVYIYQVRHTSRRPSTRFGQ